MKSRFLCLIVGLFSVACFGPRTGPITLEDPSAFPPMVMGDALVFFEPSQASLFVLDPSRKAGETGKRRVVRVSVGENPILAVEAPNPSNPSINQIIVADPGGESIHILRDKTGIIESINIGIPIENIDIREDGRFGIVYLPEGKRPTTSLVAFPNAISIVDLAEGADSPRTLRLPDAAARPIRAEFAKSLKLTVAEGIEKSASLALIFVEDGVVPVDLDSGKAGKLIALTSERGQNIRPTEVHFTNNRGDAIRGEVDSVERAFVQTTDGEIFVLAIRGSLSSQATMDIHLTLENVITPRESVYDADLFFDEEGKSLLLAAAGNEIILVDGYTGVATAIDSGMWVDEVIAYTEAGSEKERVLAYSKFSLQSQALRLNPLELQSGRSTGLEVLYFASNITSIEMSPSQDLALIRYQDTAELGFLTLALGESVLDLRLSAGVSALRLDAHNKRVWLVGESSYDEKSRLAEVNLGGALYTRDVVLDSPGRHVGQAGEFVWVVHSGEEGSVTFFPLSDFSEDSAITIAGFYWSDIIETDHPDYEEEKEGE